MCFNYFVKRDLVRIWTFWRYCESYIDRFYAFFQKKHEKKEFFRAIEEQLMYIPDVKFQHKPQKDFSFNDINILYDKMKDIEWEAQDD